jgi:hypothetical protein
MSLNVNKSARNIDFLTNIQTALWSILCSEPVAQYVLTLANDVTTPKLDMVAVNTTKPLLTTYKAVLIIACMFRLSAAGKLNFAQCLNDA